jgi:hypothetical protein
MSVEIVGTSKIIRYIERYDFKKIKLSRGTEPVYLKRAAEGESKEALIADFEEWVNEFIDSDNTREYKLELFGTYSSEPNAKLSPVVKVTVAFHGKATVTGTTDNYAHKHSVTPPVDVDKYVTMAVELATVRAQNERLEEKLDELLEELEHPEEVGAPEPKNIGEAVQGAIIGKADKIIDALLIYLTAPKVNAVAQPINGVQDTLTEFRALHPDIDADLERLLTLAKQQPEFFNLLIKQLRNMV